jgi:FKBP-type peptidyl-prolyl cis-trans isomerase
MPSRADGDYPAALVGTEKRERQRAARLEKSVAEASAAKREKSKRTGIRIAVAAVVVLAVLFGASALTGDDSDDTSSDDTSTETSTPDTTAVEFTNPELAEEVLARTPPTPAPPPADTPAGALEITTAIEGEGEGAKAGDTVTVHYVGVLADGSEFDQSWSRGETFDVSPLGQAQVIDGWNEGLMGAKIGERRRLVIGSDKAYGPQGNPPTIPAAAPLAFEIDVVDIQAGG